MNTEAKAPLTICVHVESFELLSFLNFLCQKFLSNLQMHGTHGEDGVK
jgi:hypothetical protein